MKSLIHSIILIFFLAGYGYAQKKPLPRNINKPGNNQKHPRVSVDGTHMIWMTDYTNSGDFEPVYTTGDGFERWNEPKDFAKGMFKQGLDYPGGYFISANGEELYITSRRSPGIGKYDILVATKNGTSWDFPANGGKPLNTLENEGAPSVTPDGKTMYFMRCQTMSPTNIDGCKIYRSNKKSNRWMEGQLLEGGLNEYNAAFPLILADKETLLFSSDRPGGKGGWDFYISRFEGDKWTDPQPLDFANTAADELIGTVTARGDVLFYSGEFKGSENLIIAKIPEYLRPKNILLVEGSISTGQKPVEAVVAAYDANTQEDVQLMQCEPDGTFSMYLPEGSIYDLSVYPMNNDKSFYSTLVDFETPESGKKEKLEVNLEPLSTGSTFRLNNIKFTPADSSIEDVSELEFFRLQRLFKNNTDKMGRFTVHANVIFEDTVISDPELTETVYDTLTYDFEKVMLDSLARDSIYANFALSEDSTYYYEVSRTFHNDRTGKMANSILKMLEEKGFPMEKFSAEGRGGPVGPKPEHVEYWVELTIE
jgi:hypothetical protein